MRRTSLLLNAVTLLVLAAAPSAAEAFDLDKSLAGAGIDRIPVGDRDIAGANGIATMGDGRIVMGGYAKQGDRVLGAIERLTPTGDADPAFAAETSFPGTVLIDATPVDDDEGDPVRQTVVGDVAVAPDGSVYATGVLLPDTEYDTTSGTPFVAHVLLDGRLDPAFSGGTGPPGVVLLPTSGRSGDRIKLAGDGSLYVLGLFGGQEPADGTVVTHLLPDGQRDIDYGEDGVASLGEVGAGGDVRSLLASDLALDAQGRVVLAGRAFASSSFGPMLARLTTSGALDPDFGGEPAAPAGSGGSALTIPGVELATAIGQPATKDPTKSDGLASRSVALASVAIAADGKLVVAGTGTGAGAAVGVVGRFTANGERDSSFGVKGYTAFLAQRQPDVRGRNRETRLNAVTLNGSRITAVGTVDTREMNASLNAGGPAPALLVAGFTTKGRLDPSASSGGPVPGVFTASIGGGTFPSVHAAVSAGGRVLVAGHAASPGRYGDRLTDPSSFLLVGLGQGTAAAPGPDPDGEGDCGTPVKVRSASLTGCWVKKGGDYTFKDGRVTMNGTRIDLANGTWLVATPSKGTIRTTTKSGGDGVARMSAAAPGGAVVPLSKGKLSFTVPSGGGTRAVAAETPKGCAPVGSEIGTVSTAGVGNLLGFPLPGTARVSTSAGKTYVQVNVDLPKPAFVNARGCATLVTTTSGGLRLDSLHVDVGTASFGPLQLGSVAVDYTGASDTWKGSLEVKLDLPTSVSLKGDITFTGGSFAAANISVDFAPAYLILPPYISLAGVHGGIQIKPYTRISAGVHLVAGPQLFGTAAIDADLTGTVSFPGTPYAVAVDIDGQVRVVTIPLGSSHVHYDTGGTFTIVGNAGFDAYVLDVSVDVKGGLQGKHFFLEGDARVCVLGDTVCAGARGLISEVGAAACGGLTNPIKDLALGFAIEWKDPIPEFFASCDLSAYQTFKVQRLAPDWRAGQLVSGRDGAARPRAAAEQAITVEAGTKAVAFKISGDGGTPLVDVIGPNGERLDGPGEASPGPLRADQIAHSDVGSIISYQPRQASYVALTGPAAGTWRVVPHEGSPAITTVARSTPLPAPKVTAKVGGRGRSRTLKFTHATHPGETIQFVERASKVEHRLPEVAAGASGGTLRFAPGAGAAGKREIVALVSQDGLPRRTIVVASYVAPGPLKPGRASRLRLRASGGAAVLATWRKAPRAARYVVTTSLKDGHRSTAIVSARSALRVKFPAFLPKQGGTVTVVAVDKTGLTGPRATATLKAVKAKAKKKKKKKRGGR